MSYAVVHVVHCVSEGLSMQKSQSKLWILLENLYEVMAQLVFVPTLQDIIHYIITSDVAKKNYNYSMYIIINK